MGKFLAVHLMVMICVSMQAVRIHGTPVPVEAKEQETAIKSIIESTTAPSQTKATEVQTEKSQAGVEKETDLKGKFNASEGRSEEVVASVTASKGVVALEEVSTSKEVIVSEGASKGVDALVGASTSKEVATSEEVTTSKEVVASEIVTPSKEDIASEGAREEVATKPEPNTEDATSDGEIRAEPIPSTTGKPDEEGGGMTIVVIGLVILVLAFGGLVGGYFGYKYWRRRQGPAETTTS